MRGMAEGKRTEAQKFEQLVGDVLVAQGFYEIVTYSFISPRAYDRIRLPENSPLRKSVVISNPLGEDTGVMRTTAIPSMMDILARNYNNRAAEACLYELSTRYIPTEEGKLPDESKVIMLGAFGKDFDFYAMKGVIEALLSRAGIAGAEFEPVTDNPTFHPGRCARVLTADGVELGVFGAVHPQVCGNYDIGADAYLAELSLAALLGSRAIERKIAGLPRFPASTRDLALVCAEEIPAGAIEKAVRAAAGQLLEKLELFDVYRGQQVGEGKKSMAYALTLRAADRTLTDEDCDGLVKKVLKKLAEIGVELRG
jgi:phenylalanyl-tRNA synthetase beta chain